MVGWDDGFSGQAEQLLNQAQLVIGAPRLLELPQIPASAEKAAVDGKIVQRLPELLARELRTVVLATGDPLYYGIGSTLLRFVPAERLVFHPAPTAFQKLFARLGQPWEQVRLFSLHGRKDPVPYRAILSASLAAVYGDGLRPAQKIAAELVAAFPAAADRAAACGCNLGLPDEHVLRGSLSEIAADPAAGASLSVLALLPDDRTEKPCLPFGLPDDSYEHHRNMITHPEIRAIVLSKLRLAPGVLWDLGAGSGSVGIEAGGLCRGLAVYAVEKNPERFAELEANRLAAGGSAMRTFCGAFAEVAPLLPDPDRVFIGGGGAELAAIATEAFGRLKPGGLLAVSAVLLESAALLIGELLKKHRVEVLTLNVSRAEPLGDGALFRAENPITIAVYRKERM